MDVLQFLKPAPHKEGLPEEQIDPTYKKLRWQVFFGIFIGYAGYYLVRKNFSLAMPDLIERGYTKTQLGLAISAIAIAYGISKFAMAIKSDRSNARIFLPLGLMLSAFTMIAMGILPFATASVGIMFVFLFINGWVQGMGWPPSGRVMVHWFSQKERGTKMSFWNLAHNVGGFLMPLLAVAGAGLFGVWQGKLYFPAIIALLVAMIAYLLIRDTPQSAGLPPIEEYKHDQTKAYDQSHEKEFSTKQILLDYVLVNKMIWYIAFANAFIYLVRYGVQDWAPTYLKEVKNFSNEQTAWAYSWFELAGIPGTLICGLLSDKIFRGRRAPATIIYMILVAIAVYVYWKNPAGNPQVDNIALTSIGFLIYGPVMLVGVQALDLVPKKAAGTAAGLTGLFGYLIGSVLANAIIGYVVDKQGWDGGFEVLLLSCLLAIIFTAFTWKKEKLIIKEG